MGCPRPRNRRRRPAEPWMAKRRRLRASGGQDGRSERPAMGRGQPRPTETCTFCCHRKNFQSRTQSHSCCGGEPARGAAQVSSRGPRRRLVERSPTPSLPLPVCLCRCSSDPRWALEITQRSPRDHPEITQRAFFEPVVSGLQTDGARAVGVPPAR